MADDMPVVNKQTLQGVAGFLLPAKEEVTGNSIYPVPGKDFFPGFP